MLGAEQPLIEGQGPLAGKLRTGIVAEDIQAPPECLIEACRQDILSSLCGLRHGPQVRAHRQQGARITGADEALGLDK
jgi:hypothetical protein